MTQITYSTSFIEFLKSSDCRIAKILYAIYYKEECNWRRRDKYISVIITDKELNYITFRKDGTISFLPAGKEHKINDNNEWSKEGRQNGKPSKVIRKIFTQRAISILKLKDADFECFTNAYKANYNDDGYKFELLNNKQIPSVYEMDRAEGGGSINNSCMNGDSEYLSIYKYCEKLSILILKNKDGLLCGRALIWKIDDNITLMDRIYVSQDFMYDNFLSYAIKNNYWRKEDYKSYDNKQDFINTDGEKKQKNFTVYTNTDFDLFPYIDTFQYGEDGSLNNYGGGDYTYNNTDGTREGGEDDHSGETYDDINECYISEDDAVYIENGERCYRDRYCHVEDCVEVNGNWYYSQDSNIVEVDGDYYKTDSDELCTVNDEYELTENCTFCERDDCYYLSDDCVYCEDDEEDVLREEAIEIEDKWYHKDSDKIVEINATYYLIDSDEIELKDGEYVIVEIAD